MFPPTLLVSVTFQKMGQYFSYREVLLSTGKKKTYSAMMWGWHRGPLGPSSSFATLARNLQLLPLRSPHSFLVHGIHLLPAVSTLTKASIMSMLLGIKDAYVRKGWCLNLQCFLGDSHMNEEPPYTGKTRAQALKDRDRLVGCRA